MLEDQEESQDTIPSFVSGDAPGARPPEVVRAEEQVPGLRLPSDTSIAPREVGVWERLKNVFTEGIPNISSRTVYHPKRDQIQFLSPEEVLTPTQQREHPIATGLLEVAGSLTTPENVGLITATGGLGAVRGIAAKILPRMVSAGFSGLMLKGAYEQYPEFKDAMDRGDESEALRIFTHLVATGALAGMAGQHAIAGKPMALRPRYTRGGRMEQLRGTAQEALRKGEYEKAIEASVEEATLRRPSAKKPVAIPPPPEGFVLDKPLERIAKETTPPPPEGFVLEKPLPEGITERDLIGFLSHPDMVGIDPIKAREMAIADILENRPARAAARENLEQSRQEQEYKKSIRVKDSFGDEIKIGDKVFDGFGREARVRSINLEDKNLSVQYDRKVGKHARTARQLTGTDSIDAFTRKRRGKEDPYKGIGRKPVRMFGESEEGFGARMAEPQRGSILGEKPPPVYPDPVNKVLARVSTGEKKGERLSLEGFYTNWKDALYPVKKFVDLMNEGKDPLKTEQNAYEMAHLFAGWHGKADHFLRHGTFKLEGLETKGKSLDSILKPIERDLNGLRAYIVSKRAIELEAKGKTTGIEIDSARETVEHFKDNPSITKAAKELKSYTDSLLEYVKDSGFLSEESVGQIRSMNLEYTPFYRLLEEGPMGEGIGKAFADVRSPIKRFKGSERTVIDPLESIVKNTYAFINMAERNRIGRLLVEQATKSEVGVQFVKKVPAAVKPTTFELKEIKGKLSEAGLELEGADLSFVATVFRPLIRGSAKDSTITVMQNGKSTLYKVHPELYRALKFLDYEGTGTLVRLLSMPARALRLGATALSPEFIIRNPLRDTMTAYLQSQYGFKPGIDTARGLFHAIGRTEIYWEWKRSGGEHAALVSMDRTTLQSNLKDLMRTKLGWAVHHPIEAARVLSELTEASTRLGEFQKARQAGASPYEAGFAAREVSLNFTRMGAKARAVNSMVAFWNAALEGTDKFVRVHKTDPKGALIRATVGVTIPSIMLYWLNRDDPIYKELPRWIKDFYWLIPTRGTPIHDATPFIPIPKPFLWGMVYGTVPERTMEWIDERDPSAWDDFGKSLMSVTFPSVLPTAMIPFIETVANKSLFTGRRLEPRYMEGIEPEQRALPHTSEFSKATAKIIWRVSLGKALKESNIEISPIKLDQAIFSITGGLGRSVLRGVDTLLGKGKGIGSPADIPLVRAFAIRWPTSQAESVRKFYDRLNELEQKEATVRYERRYRLERKAKPLTGRERGELIRLKGYSETMSNLYRRTRLIQNNKNLSAQQRQEQVDRLMLRILEKAQSAQQKHFANMRAANR